MIFVIQYRQNQDAELLVFREGYQTVEEAQRYVESRLNNPVKEPMTEYRYCTNAGEEYRIIGVALPWNLKKQMAPGSCSGCVYEAASRDQDCCWYCSRNPRNIRRDMYRPVSGKYDNGRGLKTEK